MLAGVLLDVQKKAFEFLNELESETISEEKVLKIAGFLSSKMNVEIDSEFDDFGLKQKADYIIGKLNRPIRVCGMVKNQGEPGGGPFWVEDENDNVSLQIVESAQIDNADENQIYFFQGSNKIKLNSKEGNIIVENDVELQPSDRIIVGNNYEISAVTGGVVTVKGFVQNPGAFPIINSKTTLSEIINQAGGLTDDAYLPLAKVYRQTNEFKELSSSRTEAFRMFSNNSNAPLSFLTVKSGIIYWCILVFPLFV